MTKQLCFVALLSVAIVLVLVETSWTQATAPKANDRGSGTGNQLAEPPTLGRSPAGPFSPYSVLPYTVGGPAGNEIGRLVGELREAEEAKKADLTKQLEAAIAKQFDRDMEARETELTKLEQRVSKLRAQLDRRHKAKADILQLQLKVLVNEAEGLGFSGPPAQAEHSSSFPPGTGFFPPAAGNGFGLPVPGPGFGGGSGFGGLPPSALPSVQPKKE